MTGILPSQRVRLLVLFTVAAAVYLLDRLTKWLVVSNLYLGEEKPTHAFVSIHYIQNSGAAFGILPQAQVFFLFVAAAVILYILIAGRKFPGIYPQIVFGLIFGGAVGNGIDRLMQGYVVDFIDFHFWPIFNVADTAISVGILLAIFTLRQTPINR